MGSFKFRSLIIWGMVLLFIEIILIFSYFIFSDKKIDIQNQLAQIFTTKASEQNNFPVLKQNQAGLALSAEAYISIFAADDGSSFAPPSPKAPSFAETLRTGESDGHSKASADKAEKILVEKNKDAQLPIASITKLMTAVIATDKYKLDDIVAITENSLKIDSLSGIYKAGDRFFFYNALRAMLIASHNEIAATLAEHINNSVFVDLMNKKSSELGLLNTKFVNATGLDPIRSPLSETSADAKERLTSNGVNPKIDLNYINHSTVSDIYKLARYITEDRPDIFYITTQKEFSLFDLDKNLTGIIKNTNKLLEEQNIPFKIIGGKTGETDLAKQNLMIVAEAPCGGNIFSVVLGSQNRFEDMNKLLQYINSSYDWSCPK